MIMQFRDRYEAGRILAQQLLEYTDQPDVIVLGLPRGGVPVAFEIAQALHAALDVFIVRKLGVPGREELAMGALASGGIRVLNHDVLHALRIPVHVLEAVTAAEMRELQRREQAYRGVYSPLELEERTTILVDDGLATGSTMRAAVAAVRLRRPNAIIVAVPTAAQETCQDIGQDVDEMICAMTPEPFHAVGLWYEDFSQTTDEEVRTLLEYMRHQPPLQTREHA